MALGPRADGKRIRLPYEIAKKNVIKADRAAPAASPNVVIFLLADHFCDKATSIEMERRIMVMEVRYIMFSPEETRQAIVAFALKEGYAGTPDDILMLSISGDTPEALSASLEIRGPIGNKTIKIAADHLTGALLLYCSGRNIPIPRRSQKMFEYSPDGLTMVLTTDLAHKKPMVVGNHITYTSIANYAQEANEAKRALALAVERTETAEAMISHANAKTQMAETAAAALAGRMTAIRLEPGLRGRLGRWLMVKPLRH